MLTGLVALAGVAGGDVLLDKGAEIGPDIGASYQLMCFRESKVSSSWIIMTN